MLNYNNFNDNVYDFYPGLSESNEVFFGKNAALSQILLKYSQSFKDLIISTNNFKDKKFLGELNRLTTGFNNEIAKEINAERVQICIIPDDSDNASAVPIFYKADLGGTKVVNGQETKYIDFDKIADLEDIVIIPNVGYKYRNPKGKILIISINTGTLKNLTVEQIAGTLCHEIGHCFQDGIFGTYKDVADIVVGNAINYGINRTRPLSTGNVIETFCNVLAYILFPKLLVKGIFNYLSDAFYRLCLKTNVKTPLDSKTYRMKDELRRLDNGESKELFEDYSNSVISDKLTALGTNDRDELADQIYEDSKNQFKEYSNKNKGTPLEKKTNAIINLFRSINLQFNMIANAGLRVITGSTYNVKKLKELSFYKKYEFFADIFASSYGFGPDLYKNVKENEIGVINNIQQYDLVGINNISLFKVAILKNRWKELRQLLTSDTHGSANERGNAIYTALIIELENNKTLTTTQKREIEQYISEIKKADEAYYKDRCQKGFWFKYYNRLIDDRIKGIDYKTEDEILGPIEDVVKTCLKEK